MAINFTYDEATNKVVVTGGTSGIPATFADFVTADRAGVDTVLLSAGTPANNLALAYAVRPVEDLAIKVKCVVANKTAEADFIFITGKDWRGAAQTENIDVTAGNGSYTTTKYWSEITTLDCSDNAAGGGVVWADGDLSVTQDVWGVIWDYGNGKYLIDSIFSIGNDIASTYFQSRDEDVFFSFFPSDNTQLLYQNATLEIGQLVSDNFVYNGAKWVFYKSDAGWHEMKIDGTFKMYGSLFGCITGDNSWNLKFYQNNIELQNSILSWNTININDKTSAIRNCTATGGSTDIGEGWDGIKSGSVFENNFSHTSIYGVSLSWGSVSKITNLKITNIGRHNIQSHALSGNPVCLNCDQWDVSDVNWAAGPTGAIWEKYTVDIHVADKDGNNLSGVTVLCEDEADALAFFVLTAADGTIAQQEVTYKKHEPGGTTTYSPHKFTISKAGIETLVLDNITVDHPIVWHLELLPALAEGDVRDGIAYGEDSEGNLELPAAGDVEDGVGFGSNGVEFTGDFEVPPEADVRDGEGYGAGGAEFEGDLDLPAIGDVEKGVQFDSLTKTGTFKKPAESDVRDGSQYGKDDTEFTGTLDLPAEADVEDGVVFDGAAKEGNFEAPAEADVEDGIGYGAGGVEFEGNLELPAEEDVEVGVGYGSLGTEFEGTYLGLKGNNLTAVLEKSVALTGHLEKKVSLTGELKS